MILWSGMSLILKLWDHKVWIHTSVLVSLSQDDEFLAQSARAGSHDTRSMDRNITKISLEDTSGNPNIANNSSVQSKNKKQDLTEHLVLFI